MIKRACNTTIEQVTERTCKRAKMLRDDKDPQIMYERQYQLAEDSVHTHICLTPHSVNTLAVYCSILRLWFHYTSRQYLKNLSGAEQEWQNGRRKREKEWRDEELTV